MLDIILQILSVIGIIILVLIVLLVVAIVLILFFPITYRAYGKKKGNEVTAWMKVNWLFGLLRARFFYPTPGKLVVKLLGFTLFDSSNINVETMQDKKEKSSPTNSRESEQDNMQACNNFAKSDNANEKIANHKMANDRITNEKKDNQASKSQSETNDEGLTERIFAKYDKIKYTILKIYDKIKYIAENISFYKELLEDKQTAELFQHVIFRLGRIWKNVHPRKLTGEIVFGTDSPDTTGYIFGGYCMLSAWLGKHINVIPDFTQSVFEGELYAAGHITVFQVLLHSLAIVFDKQFQLFVHRIKKHKI